MIDLWMNTNLNPGEVGLVGGGGALKSFQQDFYKAISAGYQADPTGLAGGGALRRESLESSIITVIQQRDDLVFLNTCPSSRATATVDQWTNNTDVGGYEGSSVNSELGDANESTSILAREIGYVKYLMDKRRVSGIAEIQSESGLMGAIALETDRGSLKVAADVEYLSFFGNSACDAQEFDGMQTLILAQGGENVIDMQGTTISGDAREFITAARVITQKDSWGKASDYFASPSMQVDINLSLAPAHRFMLGGDSRSVVLGAPVVAIETGLSPTPIKRHIARYIVEGQPPFAARASKYAAFITSSLSAPSAVAGTATPDAASKFTQDKHGNYYYAVEAAQSGVGRSVLVKSGQVAVAKGDSVSVAITEPGSNKGTHYVVYRNALNGSNADADFREMTRVPVNGGGITTYVDANQNVPGCSPLFINTLVGDALTIRRFGDQMRFPLFPTARFEHPWLQMWFGYLRMAKPQQHVMLRNCLPSTSTFRPFGV